MINYLIRRLLLLPLTLFSIVVVTFVIVNLAPGDPTTVTEISAEGLAARREDRSVAFGSDDRYLQFREFYGLTLPILINTWPFTTEKEVYDTLWKLVHRKENPESTDEMDFKEYDALRIRMGDKARFVMPILLKIMEDSHIDPAIRQMAIKFFIRGGTRQAVLGPGLSEEDKLYNRKIAKENDLLNTLMVNSEDTPEVVSTNIAKLREWYEANKEYYNFEPTKWQKIGMLFETRFTRYMQRVLTLDFGTMRNDTSKTVVNEVVKRFKYSLTLSILPMFFTFFLCQFFGFLMAYEQHRWPDYTLNVLFLVLYAIPIFVVAPFLIEKVALRHTFPFTNTPIPLSGFTSPDAIYENMTSLQRLLDTLQHIALPLVAIMYGALAAQARLSRTAVLEVLRQDYVRTAYAKGASPAGVLFHHVGRNAAVTIVTSLAGSLGVILAGSLIVETLFEINGFGKFFYDAVINRDYNVIMFSTIAGSFLALVGYLVADIAYTVLDPRVTLE